jgi:hypothetical protein
LIKSLGNASAGAQLLSRGLQLNFGRAAAMAVPGMTALSSNAGFVAQGSPIPVRQLDTSGGILLTLKKLASISVFTREIFEHSIPSAEDLVADVVSRSIGLKLDDALFSSAAASATTPPGLLNGVSALSATAGGGVAAMTLDIGNLAGAVAAVGGLNIVFICDPKTAAKLALARGPNFSFEVMSSGALAANTVVAVAPDALASATGQGIQIQVRADVQMHMENTSPTDIVSGGNPASGNVASGFQSDFVAVRTILDVAWAPRVSGAVAYVTNVTW